MKRKLIVHWTAGTYSPNKGELSHYMYLIDGEGNTIEGTNKPQDNDDCHDGKYSAHIAGINTRTISLAYCGMMGYKSPKSVGNYPLKMRQVEKGFRKAAEILLSEGWNGANTSNVRTHYEIGKMVESEKIKRTKLTEDNIGKPDINYLPPYPSIRPEVMGNFIRNRINWHIGQIKNGK